jgi:hypothetical protein
VVAALAQAGSSAPVARSAPDRLVVVALAQTCSSAQAARSVPDRLVVVALAQTCSSAQAARSAPDRLVVAYPLVQDRSVVSSVQVVAVAQVMVRMVSFLLASALGWRLPAPPQKIV